jgi:hypothetical protein
VSLRLRRLSLVLVAAAGLLSAPTLATPAYAQAAVECAKPGSIVAAVPWAQRMLAPDRVWPFTTGVGVVVAVLDSGVDAKHPQLRDAVTAGFDALANAGRADDDCAGTGTQVAGVIAARRTQGIGLAGIAPGAKIMPVRVIDGTSSVVSTTVLARGIKWAVDNGANVIVVSVTGAADSTDLRDAVAHAIDRRVAVVAAVGDDRAPSRYPATYPDVVGVGAIDVSGAWSGSATGSFVNVVAPGAAVETTQRGQGHVEVDGTGVAAGFVGATAALVRARRSTLTAGDIAYVLRTTATPAPEGPGSVRYGGGVLNPYAAVNEPVTDRTPIAPLVGPSQLVAQPSAGSHDRDLALAGAVAAALLVLAAVGVAVALPRGRRRFWRAGLASPPPPPASTEPAPPAPLFDGR